MFEKINKAKRREKNPGFIHMTAYVYKLPLYKTELEVPDNRLCNALTLVWLDYSDEVPVFS